MGILSDCLRSQLDWLKGLIRNIDPYVRAFFDGRTPWQSKILLGAALGYIFSPFDLVPDFLPLVGQVDDVLVVAVLLYFARETLPTAVKRDYWPEGTSG